MGKYRQFRPLAEGGMGSVFLGWAQSEFGVVRPVALKRLHAQFAFDRAAVERFLFEARIAASLRHPHVVPTLDVVADAGAPVLVMSYVHGESLAQLLRLAAVTGHAMPADVAARIAIDVLEGLHAAHELANAEGMPLHLVHRDVSPQNVMVDFEGHAYLVDFGVAKAALQGNTTEAGSFRGKLAYCAPEQMEEAPVDRRADLWAMGVVLWEMLAGRRLFEGLEPSGIVAKISSPFTPPPVSKVLDAVVRVAVSLSRDERFGTARAMAVAIEAACAPASHRTVRKWVGRIAQERKLEKDALLAQLHVAAQADDGGPPSSREPEPFLMPERRPSRGLVTSVVFASLVGVLATMVVIGSLGGAAAGTVGAIRPPRGASMALRGLGLPRVGPAAADLTAPTTAGRPTVPRALRSPRSTTDAGRAELAAPQPTALGTVLPVSLPAPPIADPLRMEQRR
jgi:eukaryotic-like serine/threonine-protein kinase